MLLKYVFTIRDNDDMEIAPQRFHGSDFGGQYQA